MIALSAFSKTNSKTPSQRNRRSSVLLGYGTVREPSCTISILYRELKELCGRSCAYETCPFHPKADPPVIMLTLPLLIAHIHCVFLLLDPSRLDANIAATQTANVPRKSFLGLGSALSSGVLEDQFDLQVFRTLQGKTSMYISIL